MCIFHVFKQLYVQLIDYITLKAVYSHCNRPLGVYVAIKYKMLSYRRETALQGAL